VYCSVQLVQPAGALLEAMGAHAASPASYELVISTGLLDQR